MPGIATTVIRTSATKPAILGNTARGRKGVRGQKGCQEPLFLPSNARSRRSRLSSSLLDGGKAAHQRKGRFYHGGRTNADPDATDDTGAWHGRWLPPLRLARPRPPCADGEAVWQAKSGCVGKTFDPASSSGRCAMPADIIVCWPAIDEIRCSLQRPPGKAKLQ